MIRTAIREEQEHYRHRNVAKLLFMHMLGMWCRCRIVHAATRSCHPSNGPSLREDAKTSELLRAFRVHFLYCNLPIFLLQHLTFPY
jgi:hypothetical protein